MKPRPTPRPSPRTLAAAPPPPQRAPQATHVTARFPALATLLAGASLASGCHDPQCGEDRGDELETHGREALRAARGGNGSDALRQLGVALGLTAHTRTTAPDIPVAGAAPVVQTTPRVPPQVPQVPQVPPPEMPPAGGIPAVDPTPPPQPPQPPPDQRTTPGNRPTPQRDAIPRPGMRVPVTTTPRPSTPEPRPAVPGGLGMTSPLPRRG